MPLICVKYIHNFLLLHCNANYVVAIAVNHALTSTEMFMQKMEEVMAEIPHSSSCCQITGRRNFVTPRRELSVRFPCDRHYTDYYNIRLEVETRTYYWLYYPYDIIPHERTGELNVKHGKQYFCEFLSVLENVIESFTKN